MLRSRRSTLTRNGVQTRRRLTVTSRKLSTPALLPQMPPSRNLPETLDASIVPTNAAIEKFAAKAEVELWDVVDTLQRAISIIQGEMAEKPAFLQRCSDTRNLKGRCDS